MPSSGSSDPYGSMIRSMEEEMRVGEVQLLEAGRRAMHSMHSMAGSPGVTRQQGTWDDVGSNVQRHDFTDQGGERSTLATVWRDFPPRSYHCKRHLSSRGGSGTMLIIARICCWVISSSLRIIGNNSNVAIRHGFTFSHQHVHDPRDSCHGDHDRGRLRQSLHVITNWIFAIMDRNCIIRMIFLIIVRYRITVTGGK